MCIRDSLWIATSAELFSCYDLKKDCFVDFTGCGEYEQLYSYKMTDREGNVWLWQDGNGCRKAVSYTHLDVYKRQEWC